MDAASTNKTTYNGADLYQNAGRAERRHRRDQRHGHARRHARRREGGRSTRSGKGSFGDNADVKAALATRRPGLRRADADPDEGLLRRPVGGHVRRPSPARSTRPRSTTPSLRWSPPGRSGPLGSRATRWPSRASSPSWATGYDSSNHASTLTGHAPPKTIAYAEVHDVGQALTAILAKFRALPEAKAAFDSFDQAVAVLGGSEAAFGWIGDVALDVAPGADGTIGGGVLIQPKDADAGKRFFTTIGSALQLAGGSSGLTIRTEDHGGTPITIVDFSKVSGDVGGRSAARLQARDRLGVHAGRRGDWLRKRRSSRPSSTPAPVHRWPMTPDSRASSTASAPRTSRWASSTSRRSAA